MSDELLIHVRNVAEIRREELEQKNAFLREIFAIANIAMAESRGKTYEDGHKVMSHALMAIIIKEERAMK